MSKTGVIIARFQSPYLHEGHKALITSVQERHNQVVIVLGVSPVRGSRRNPLDFPTRERMIKKEFPDVVVLPLSDHPLDTRWSQQLDTLLASAFPGGQFVLYGSRDSFKTYYSGGHETVELPETGGHNSTLIREKISDKVLDSQEFRTGIIYAYANTYLKVFPTVDVALFRNNRTELLLGRKDIDNKWRVPGGFCDPTDASYEEAAARELREECGALEISALQYMASFRMDDWRYRREEDKIITTLFAADFLAGTPIGSDDIAEVAWFTLAEVATLMANGQTALEHTPQLTAVLSTYHK